MQIIEVPSRDVEIPERAIASRMGFKGIGTIPEEFRKWYVEVREIAMELSKPSAAIDLFIPSSYDDIKGISIDRIEITGTLAKSQLGKSVEITAMLVTLGSDIDDKISELHESGEELKSFMLDAIGSELVEYVARSLDGDLRSKRSLKGSARIAPGYVDLPISLNEWFAFKFGKMLSVKSDPQSFTFLPRKTISAFIGWSN
jgi:hypothetical protein|uniref:Methionine synthase n=1 Tax=Mesoaciditoga lauensis TaxID=1495039 RepID=A0A7V3RFW0_9BACT